jgi:hypothetical protein
VAHTLRLPSNFKNCPSSDDLRQLSGLLNGGCAQSVPTGLGAKNPCYVGKNRVLSAESDVSELLHSRKLFISMLFFA